MRLHIVSILLSITTSLLYGQSTIECIRSLENAELAFEQGRLLFILDREQNKSFFSCLEAGTFEFEEKVRAYKLLTKAYIFTDNEQAAEEALINLLKTDHEHILQPNDPAELRFLYAKYRTDPIFRIALRLGGNVTETKILREFSTFQGNLAGETASAKTYGLNPAFWAEVIIERHITKGWEVGIGSQYRFSSFRVQGTIVGTLLNYTINHSSSALRFPLIIRYNHNYLKKNSDGGRISLLPYVFIGVAPELVLSAQFINTTREGGTSFSLPAAIADANILGKNQVRNFNAAIFAGLGAKLRVGKSKVNFFTFELRYDNTLLQHNEGRNRFANSLTSINIGYVEDDLTLNFYSFSIGYTRSIYLEKKRKEK